VVDPTFARHAVTKEKNNVKVTLAILTAQESQDYFGVPLESKEIQAVWLRVENRNEYNLYIVPRSTDPDYYSAYEASYVNHRPFARSSNEAMDRFFQLSRIKLRVPADHTNTGFLFTNLDEGTKFVNIEMVHDLGAICDGFFFQLPNGAFDYEDLSAQQHYVFPVMWGELPLGIEYSIGPGFGLTRASDHVIMKFNLSVERFIGAIFKTLNRFEVVLLKSAPE
jgi:hypothetical protein